MRGEVFMEPRQYHVQPRSKKDRTLPYTYEAWVDILEGEGLQPVYDHYFSDTLCGVIECLDRKGILPDHVQLYGLYRGKQTQLDVAVCTDDEGTWLSRPTLCRVLEEHYDHTHEECYRGHVEDGHCSFEDRERKSAGPVW
jgi:hypothetical protein